MGVSERRPTTSRNFFRTFLKTLAFNTFLIDSGAILSRTIIDKTTTEVWSPCSGCEIKVQSSADLEAQGSLSLCGDLPRNYLVTSQE
jgi:hypothetical protein